MESRTHALTSDRQLDILLFSEHTAALSKKAEGYGDLTVINSIEIVKAGGNNMSIVYHIEALIKEDTVYRQTVIDKGDPMPEQWVVDMVKNADAAIQEIRDNMHHAELTRYMALNNELQQIRESWSKRERYGARI